MLMLTVVAEVPQPDEPPMTPNRGHFLTEAEFARFQRITGGAGAAVADAEVWTELAPCYPRDPDFATLTFEYDLPPLPNARPSNQRGFRDRSGMDTSTLERIARGLRRNSGNF